MASVLFTIERANQALALVAPVTQDIVAKMGEARRLHNDVKDEKTRAAMNEVELLEKLRHAEKLLNEVEYHMKELVDIGVIFQDFHLGIVDFPCLYQGRQISLCWMFGEREIRAWHELNEGFEQRKSVAMVTATPAL